MVPFQLHALSKSFACMLEHYQDKKYEQKFTLSSHQHQTKQFPVATPYQMSSASGDGLGVAQSIQMRNFVQVQQ